MAELGVGLAFKASCLLQNELLGLVGGHKGLVSRTIGCKIVVYILK
jgi:hypothetical protein